MTNAIRHGKAGSVRVEIFEKRRTRAEGKFKTGPALHLTIQDDGHGIGADTPAGFGLTVMRERIHALGGSFIIESAPARGTTLLIIFPIQNRTAEGSKLREGRAMQSSRRAGLDRLQIPRRARRSSEGKRNGMYRHGQFTKEALEERALLRALLERSREPLLTRAQLNGSFLGPRLVTAKDVAMVLLAHGFESHPLRQRSLLGKGYRMTLISSPSIGPPW